MVASPGFLLSHLPTLLMAIALAVCAVLAITKRAKLGARASILAATGLSLISLARFINIAYVFFVLQIVHETGSYALITIIGILLSLIDLAGMGLTIAAIFVRRPAQGPYPY